MTTLLLFLLAFGITFFGRKLLLTQFKFSNKLVYYHLVVIISIFGAMTQGIMLHFFSEQQFGSDEIGELLTLIIIIYFIFTIPQLYKTQDGKYFINEKK